MPRPASVILWAGYLRNGKGVGEAERGSRDHIEADVVTFFAKKRHQKRCSLNLEFRRR